MVIYLAAYKFALFIAFFMLSKQFLTLIHKSHPSFSSLVVYNGELVT
jgi:hypothetical protein